MQDCYPRWMNLKTAAWYSSIGQKRLKQLAIAGKISGYKDMDDGRGGWIFDRFSIDEYRERKCLKIEARATALDILARVK